MWGESLYRFVKMVQHTQVKAILTKHGTVQGFRTSGIWMSISCTFHVRSVLIETKTARERKRGLVNIGVSVTSQRVI